MTNRTPRWLVTVAVGASIVAGPALRGFTQTGRTAPTGGQAAADKDGCTRNLKAIYAAIEAYQYDHKDLPNWLSDLVPQYLPDANVLICPVCRRTGETVAPVLADPKLPTSYLFEFCPMPLGTATTNAPVRTRREWKRRQMGLVGSVVPMVRCRHHEPVLNLAFDGKIYDSPQEWERLVTNRVRAIDLTPGRLFADGARPGGKAGGKQGQGPRFEPRDSDTPKALLNLSAYYNAALNQSWQGVTGDNLGSLPKGVQALGGVEFDVRGIVQLRSASPSSTNYPAQVNGIKLRQRCHWLHFLHAAGFGRPEDEGKQIGAFVIHYGTNQMPVEIPIRYGHEVRNWHGLPDELAPPKELKVAWVGANAVSKAENGSIRLFLTTWTNPKPDALITSIDYVSSMAQPAPFLVAISME